MAWVYLVLAGLLEVGWAIGLKYTNGFTRLWPTIATLLIMAASFSLLSMAMRSLPLGTAYAIWTGIGAIGTALVGVVLFAEPASLLRIGALSLIVLGIMGLKLAS